VCHNSLQKYQFSEVKPSQTHFWEPPSFSWQLLSYVVNHTLLLIWSVSRFSTKYQFSEVKPSQTHFWEPPSFPRQLLVRVVNHTPLLIRSVSRFSTKISVQWGQTLTDALLRTSEFFSADTRARSKSRTTPNTECVTILYQNISSVRSTPHRRTFENLRVFLGSYSCA